jgi:exodeoxyribonuclease-3
LAQGWVDELRTRHPDEPICTFGDHFRQHGARNSGLRIDYLLLNPTLAARLVDAGVDRWVRGTPGASDHAPAWMRLR